MSWKPYERARLAHRVRSVSVELGGIGDALIDLKLYNESTQTFEASIQLYALERQLLELPPVTGAPAPQQDVTCRAEELPF